VRRLGPIALAGLLAACGNDDRMANGTSSEVPNALTGRVMTESGTPAIGCKVRVASSLSWSDSTGRVDSTVTDSAGRWVLPLRSDSGSLVVLFQDAVSMGIASLDPDDHGIARNDTVRAQAWIRGSVVGATGSSKVSLRGTSIWAATDSTGTFLLGPVPAALLDLLVATDSAGTSLRKTLRQNAVAGDTVLAPVLTVTSATWESENYALWPASRLATIDLTPAGANVTGDHAGFPVPIRLDTVLDVKSTNPGEIRFDNGEGVRYPFTVEQWDAVSGKALVWVRLDTANGSSNKHDLRVLWGRSGARIPSDMPDVFDATNGFAAAWHLDSSREASLAGSLAWTGSIAGTGVWSGAQVLSESDSFASDSVELGGAASWTVSLWVRLDKKPSGETLLAGFSDGPDSVRWGVSIRDDQFVRVWSGADALKSLEADKPLVVGVWTHVAATFESSTERIGLVVDTTVYDRQKVSFPRASRQRMRGGSGASAAFDEIRLSSLDRAPQWSILEGRVADPTWLRWK